MLSVPVSLLGLLLATIATFGSATIRFLSIPYFKFRFHILIVPLDAMRILSGL